MRSSRPWQTASALALWLISACAHEVQERDLAQGAQAEGSEPRDSDGSPLSGTGGGSGFFAGGGGSKAVPNSPSGGMSANPNGKASGGQGTGGKASGGAGGSGGSSTAGKAGSSGSAGASGKAGAGGGSGGGLGGGGAASTHQTCKVAKLPVEGGESSSDEAATLGPELAFDGVATTRWSSGHTEPQWLALDMGEAVRVARVLIRWEAAYAADYQIAIADDEDGPYRALFREREGNGGTDDVDDFDPDSGRFVRFTGTTRATNFGFSIFELEIYGDADEACIAQ